MSMTQRIKTIFPFLLLLAVISLLAYELYQGKPPESLSNLIGESMPAFTVNNLYSKEPPLTNDYFQNEVVLLNVWASWCEACRLEHEMLMKISKQNLIPIYGLAYNDKESDAKQLLQTLGNPYKMVGIDNSGDLSIELGIYGTPETFIINRGNIVYKQIGPIDQKTWDKTLYPFIKKLK